MGSEWRIGIPSKAFRRELKEVFPNIDPSVDLSVAVLLQDAKVDLLSDSYFKVKDKCLENFFNACNQLIELLPGEFCDYIDPTSGYPMVSEPAGIYSEIDACQRLIRLPLISVGGCYMLSHPVYGTRLYPASFITTASQEKLQAALDKVQVPEIEL